MPQKLTQLLIDHRASGVLIADLPLDLLPQTADEAYRIQNESIAVLGPVGAWKVQPMPESGQPFAAPILARTIFPDGAELRIADFPSLGIEVEVAVTLDRDLPLRDEDYTADDLQTCIGSVHLAFEILASRFTDRSKVPLLAGIADLQHSGAIVLAAAVTPSPLPEFGTQSIVLSIDDAVVAVTPGNAKTSNMLTALAWLANHAARRGLPLKPGDVVITGSRIGPLPVNGRHVVATADGLGQLRATFV